MMSSEKKKQEKKWNISCDRVNLIFSKFHQEIQDSADNFGKIEFIIQADVYSDGLVSKLKVNIFNHLQNRTEKHLCRNLEFVLAGIFSCNEEATDIELQEFAKGYTLSILWPYAREYASDVFSRSGLPFPELPIINPQSVTKDMISKDLITINNKGYSIKEAKSE